MQLSKVHAELAEVKSGVSFAMEDSKERQKIAEMHHMLKEAEVIFNQIDSNTKIAADNA